MDNVNRKQSSVDQLLADIAWQNATVWLAALVLEQVLQRRQLGHHHPPHVLRAFAERQEHEYQDGLERAQAAAELTPDPSLRADRRTALRAIEHKRLHDAETIHSEGRQRIAAEIPDPRLQQSVLAYYDAVYVRPGTPLSAT